MGTTLKFSLLAIVTSLVLNTALAQEHPAQMADALSNILRMEGYWEGPATLNTEGKTYKVTMYVDFRKTDDGRGLTLYQWWADPELGTYKGTSLVGYSTNDEKVHWLTVDNFGTAHEHLGTWISADHFFMQANETIQQKKFIEEVDLVFKDNNTLELNEVGTLNGEVIENIKATFHRKMRKSTK